MPIDPWDNGMPYRKVKLAFNLANVERILRDMSVEQLGTVWHAEASEEQWRYINPELVYDWSSRVVFFPSEGRSLKLPRVQGKILEVLTRQANRLVPHDRLCESVWESPYYEPPNLSPHISKLKKAIKANSPRFNIRSIPGSGYILKDHNWSDVAEYVRIDEDGAIKYFPHTRDLDLSEVSVPLTETEARIVQTL